MDRVRGVIFTDLPTGAGFGRSAGAYRFASEYRAMGINVKVVSNLSTFTFEEIKQIIKNCSDRGAEWVGFSITFITPRKNGRVQLLKGRGVIRHERITEQTITGFPPEEDAELLHYIGDLGMRVRVGGSGIINFKDHYDKKRVKVEFQLGQDIEKRFFKNFNFTKSKILWSDEDSIFPGEDLPIEISRGCIFKCSFCGFHLTGKAQWDFTKSPDTLREEMISNYDRFGTTGYMFCDDTYNDSEEKITELLKMYRTLPFNLRFSSYARFDIMAAKPHTQDILYESGLRSAFLGIETFNKQAGKMVGKGMDPDKQKKALIDFKKKYPDVLIHISLIAGLPGESLKEIEESLDFLQELNGINGGVSWDTAMLMLSEQSPMTKNPNRYGFTKIHSPFRWEREDLTSDEVKSFMKEKSDKITRYLPHTFVGYNRMRNIGFGDQMINSFDAYNEYDRKVVYDATIEAEQLYKDSQLRGI